MPVFVKPLEDETIPQRTTDRSSSQDNTITVLWEIQSVHTHQSKKLNTLAVCSLMCIDVFMSAVSLTLSHALMNAILPETHLYGGWGGCRGDNSDLI